MDAPMDPAAAAAMQKALAANLYWGDFTLVAYSCFFTLLCYDIVITLPEERAKIWKARWSWVKGLYLFNRYFGLIAFLGTLLMYNIQVTTEVCNKYVKFEPGLLIPVFAAYQAILAVRCFALWGRNYIVGALMTLLIAVNIIYQLYVTTQTTAIAIPGYEKFSCIVTGDNKLISGYFLLPLAVDFAITVVSGWKVYQLTKTTESPVLRVFAREGAFFFSVVFFCNLANGILYLQPYRPVSSIFAAGATILSNIMACKLILSLRSPDALNDSNNQDSRHASASNQNKLMARRTANMSMPRDNANLGHDDTSSNEKEIKMDDLESYLPAVGDQVLVTKTRTVQYGP